VQHLLESAHKNIAKTHYYSRDSWPSMSIRF